MSRHGPVFSLWSIAFRSRTSWPTTAELWRVRKLRPSAAGDIKPLVSSLDELLWEKNLLGRVPQICLDLFARQYALEMVMLLTHIDQRLNEEKQKLSALDFDDLELRALDLLARPEVVARAAERYKFFLVDEFQERTFARGCSIGWLCKIAA